MRPRRVPVARAPSSRSRVVDVDIERTPPPPLRPPPSARIRGTTCFRHLFNTFIDGGCKAERKWLEPLLAEGLEAAPRHLRLSAEVEKLVRALAKGLGGGFELYGLGSYEDFRAWLEEAHPELLYPALVRADKGMRQDFQTKAARNAYINRAVNVEYLASQRYGSGNILRDNLYIMLTCKEVIAALRGRAIWDDKFTDRVCFWAADSSLEGWSCLDKARVMRVVRDRMRELVADPSPMLDEDYDLFEELHDVPAYVAYLEQIGKVKSLSVNKKVKIPVAKTVRSEIYSPKDATNAPTDDLVKEQVRAFASGVLATLEGGQGGRYVDEGEYSEENQTPDMRAAFEYTLSHTNASEGFFGSTKHIDDVYHCATYNANGVACAAKDQLHSVLHDKYVRHSKRRVAAEQASKSTRKKWKRCGVRAGRQGELGAAGLEAATTVARTSGKRKIRADANADLEEARAAKRAKRKAKRAEALTKTVKLYVAAQEKHALTPVVDDATVRRTTLPRLTAQLDGYLATCASDNARARALKETLQRLVDGMGLSQLKPRSYTSAVDDTVGAAGSPANIAFLRGALLAAFKEIKESTLELPSEPYVPEMHTRELYTLGEPTLQRVEVEGMQTCSGDELAAEAAKYREQRRAACPAGSKSRRRDMPEINDKLKGRRIDVAWNLTYKLKGGGEVTKVFWCPGTIAAVSTVETTGEDGKTLGTGWIFVKYDDKSSGWLLATRPTFWNATKAGAWRWWKKGDEDESDDESDDESAIREDMVASDDDDDEDESDDSDMDDE